MYKQIFLLGVLLIGSVTNASDCYITRSFISEAFCDGCENSFILKIDENHVIEEILKGDASRLPKVGEVIPLNKPDGVSLIAPVLPIKQIVLVYEDMDLGNYSAYLCYGYSLPIVNDAVTGEIFAQWETRTVSLEDLRNILLGKFKVTAKELSCELSSFLTGNRDQKTVSLSEETPSNTISLKSDMGIADVGADDERRGIVYVPQEVSIRAIYDPQALTVSLDVDYLAYHWKEVLKHPPVKLTTGPQILNIGQFKVKADRSFWGSAADHVQDPELRDVLSLTEPELECNVAVDVKY